MERRSGILLPIFSLPSKYGAGSFGKESFDFIDFLAKSNVKLWQILPLVQTGYGNSPYSSVCSTSFNPYFISVEMLKDEGLLDEEDLLETENEGFYVDYEFLYGVRFSLLKKAFKAFDKNESGFKKFIREKKFFDYAVFSALKTLNGYKPFYEWDEPFKKHDKDAIQKFYKQNRDEVLFWQFVQYVAEKQWKAVKKYANAKGVGIVGDMPLYVALDSVDVWVNPELFKLDENFCPKKVAGVPPDYFSSTGQLWGNPVYDYSVHIKDNFSWWKNRIKIALDTFDLVRIDHFRGLDRFYEIENGRPDATVGEWVQVPGKELFDEIKKEVGKDKIIAEDLGVMDDGVKELLNYTGFPGMKILSFAFSGETDNSYLPENIESNSVCYTGTHDNDTLKGLIDNLPEHELNTLISGVKRSAEILGLNTEVNRVSVANVMVELGFKCKADTFVLPMQDVLGLGRKYRINEPGTVKNENWSVRLSKQDFSDSVSEKLKELNEKYNR